MENPIVDAVGSVVRLLVDQPDRVQIRVQSDKLCTVIEVEAHPNDVGKIVGKGGKTADAIRVLLNRIGITQRKNLLLQILD